MFLVLCKRHCTVTSLLIYKKQTVIPTKLCFRQSLLWTKTSKHDKELKWDSVLILNNEIDQFYVFDRIWFMWPQLYWEQYSKVPSTADPCYTYIFFHSRVTEKNNPYSSKEIIEEADFCGLKSKLSGFPVSFTTVVFFR